MTTALELVQRAQLDPTDTLVCIDAMALDDAIKRITIERNNLLETLRSACRDIDGACRRLVAVLTRERRESRTVALGHGGDAMNTDDTKIKVTVKLEPVERDLAGERAREAGMTLSDWIALAIRRESARQTADRAMERTR